MNQTSQLLSVPYALYAGNSNTKLNLLGQDYISLNNQTLTINIIDLNDDVDGILSVNNGGTGTSTATMIGVITAADAPAARVALGLGTAAITASGDYATAAQGVTADAALPAANVSTFGATLIDDADAATARATLELGTAATTNALAFGIADTNVIKVDDTDAADDDFAKFTANGIEGRDASEMRTDLGLVVGTNVQAFDPRLADLSGISAADGTIIVGNGSNLISETSTTARNSLGIISGIITMDAVTSITETVAGITANSHVVVSFKSGKNGRQVVSVVPGTNSITINLSGDS